MEAYFDRNLLTIIENVKFNITEQNGKNTIYISLPEMEENTKNQLKERLCIVIYDLHKDITIHYDSPW